MNKYSVVVMMSVDSINSNFTIKECNTIYRDRNYKSSPSAKEELRCMFHLVIDKITNKI